MMEYKINKYLKLRLENGKTVIFIDNEPFILCKGIFIDIPAETEYLDINSFSIDELSENSEQAFKHNIPPETLFWAHSSNLQVWAEHDYNTSLLHSNIAFPILNRLRVVGDPVAKKVFKEEIGKRFSSGFLPTIKFLEEESYLSYLNEIECGIILENLKLDLEKKNIEQLIEVLDYLDEINFPNATKTLKELIRRGLSSGNTIFSDLISNENYRYYHNKSEIYECLISGEILNKISRYVYGDFEVKSEFNTEDSSGFIIEGNRITGIEIFGYLSESFPEIIFGLESLKNLKICSGNLQSLPENIDRLETLEKLYLDGTKLKNLPEAIGKLHLLNALNLDSNNLSILPTSICNLKNLESLSLISNNIKELPKLIGNLKSLKMLNLCSNNLTALPKSFANLDNLQELYLDGNQFSTFPEVITKLKSLKKLNLELNRIDYIPESLGSLSLLTELNLGGNEFKELSDSIGELKSLKTLSVTQSKLRKLPESVGNLKSLEKLYLFNHELTSLPKSLDNLESLNELDVRTNKIKNFLELLTSFEKLNRQKIKIYK